MLGQPLDFTHRKHRNPRSAVGRAIENVRPGVPLDPTAIGAYEHEAQHREVGDDHVEIEPLAQTLRTVLDDEALLALLDSSDPAVRKIVVQTLGKMRGEKYLVPLGDLRNDPDPSVRQAVVTAESSIAKGSSRGLVTQSPGASQKMPKKKLGMP